MSYLSWNETTIKDFDPKNIETLYDQGFVFTRLGKGVLHQTRSIRIDLSHFEPSSENRRILKKSEHIILEEISLPYKDYSWEIGKRAKDFYESRDAEFSANKIKELLTSDRSNFTHVLLYKNTHSGETIGYCIIFKTETLIHYSYPFYAENESEPSRGLGMMLKAIEYARTLGKKYIYLGSLQRPTDTYKLQFKGLEWFDGKEWKTDTEEAKVILKA